MDDLTDLIGQHWSDGAAPRPGLAMRGATLSYDQATVVEWDPATGENIIRYRGQDFPNVPMIGSTDILVTQPGDQVAVMVSTPAGGAGVMWITGRIVVPGTESAARSIQFMTSALAKEIAAAIFAERIHTSEVLIAQVEKSATTWGNPDSGTAGPTLTDVDVTDAGVIMAFVTARCSAGRTGTGDYFGSQYGVRVTGPVTREPDVHSYLAFASSFVISPPPSSYSATANTTATALALITGLPAGTYTLHGQVRSLTADAPAIFGSRHIAAIGL